MLEALRRLLSKAPTPPDLAPLRSWAQAHGHDLRRVHAAEGCVIEGFDGAQAWRIEWGASQRSYIAGHELRMICELGLPRDLLVLVLNRELMESLEKSAFEQYVQSVQTRIDTDTPFEVRWLVMFPKLSGAELGRLHERYAAVGSARPWLLQWLGGALGDALAATLDDADAQEPVVLTVGRGRLTLRTAMPEPDAAALERWFALFQPALREARRIGHDGVDAADAATATQGSAWSSSQLQPRDDDRDGVSG